MHRIAEDLLAVLFPSPCAVCDRFPADPQVGGVCLRCWASVEYRVGLVLSVLGPVATGIAVIVGSEAMIGAVGEAMAAVGIWLVDDAFVRAGQSVPLS